MNVKIASLNKEIKNVKKNQMESLKMKNAVWAPQKNSDDRGISQQTGR